MWAGELLWIILRQVERLSQLQLDTKSEQVTKKSFKRIFVSRSVFVS